MIIARSLIFFRLARRAADVVGHISNVVEQLTTSGSNYTGAQYMSQAGDNIHPQSFTRFDTDLRAAFRD